MRIAVSAPARMDRSSRWGPTIRSTFPTIPASLLGAPRCQREERLSELGQPKSLGHELSRDRGRVP